VSSRSFLRRFLTSAALSASLSGGLHVSSHPSMIRPPSGDLRRSSTSFRRKIASASLTSWTVSRAHPELVERNSGVDSIGGKQPSRSPSLLMPRMTT
jgi:hypothetical protein